MTRFPAAVAVGEPVRPRPWDEQRASEYMRSVGSPVRRVGDRYWYAPPFGAPLRYPRPDSRSSLGVLWRPVDFLRPVTPAPVRGPARGSLGYHAIVEEGANSTLPIAVVPELQAYDTDRITRRGREALRMSQRRCEAEVQTDPEFMLAQGYDVLVDGARRTGQVVDESAGDFRRRLTTNWAAGPELVVAASSEGRMGAYLTAYAIGTRGYLSEVAVSERALPWSAGYALYWEALTVMKSWGVRDVYVGWWIPELGSLAKFKRTLGAVIRRYPARVRLNPAVGAYLRTQRPVAYRRLGGPGWARAHGFDPDDDSAQTGSGRG